MAEQEDQENKTEEPTSKRLEEARTKGHVPLSREVVNWFTFGGIIVTVGFLLPFVLERVAKVLRAFIALPHQFSVEGQGLQILLTQALLEIGLATLVIFLLFMLLGIIGTTSQVGLLASTELIKPKWEKLSVLSGLKRLFSKNSLMELAKGIAKLILIGAVVYVMLKPSFENMDWAIGLDMMRLLESVHDKSLYILLTIMVIITVMAVIDFVYQRYTYHKSLMMTRTEVRDEHKQQEGDPMIKSRLRAIRMEKARKRMMSQVPKADVIITNPTHYAVALEYKPGEMGAPKLLAKGADLIAGRIRALAEENGIPLVSNPPLARALYKSVDIDQEIPAEHYRAVAEIISYVFKLKQKPV